MKEPSLLSDLVSLFARTRNKRGCRSQWFLEKSQFKDCHFVSSHFVRFHKAQYIPYLCTEWSGGGGGANMAAFSAQRVFFQPFFPKLKRRVIKLCFYLGRGKLTIEIMSQKILELNNLFNSPCIDQCQAF